MTTRRIAAALIAAVALAVPAVAAEVNLTPGTKAPAISLPTLDGKTFTLQECFQQPAKVVVLDFWATWCPPCRAEIPYLVDLHKTYKDKGVTFAGIALDDKDAVQSFAKREGITYAVALDPDARKTGIAYKIMYIPVTYVIDKKGVIRYVHPNFPRTKDEQKKEVAKLDSEIKKLLAEK